MKTSTATFLFPCVLLLSLVLHIRGASVARSDRALGNSSDRGNASDHGNDTDHGDDHGHKGIHVAAWNFDYVELPLLVCLFILVVALSKILYHHANFLSSYIPESCILIILGTVVGLVFHFTGAAEINSYFTPKMFFLFLLPPIILESAYSLHDRTFFDNIGVVLVFAVAGTILNFIILGPALYGLAACGAMGEIEIDLVSCFLFASLIVAVDPVAVLAIFQEVGVNNVLYFLVFGESLLNDAVTVVLYNMMKTFAQMDTIPAHQIILGIVSFFTISLGGLTIGIILGILASIVLKYCSHVRVVEPLFMFVFAYMSYLCAELFHFSGIISCIGCGLMQTQYAFHNISHKSYTTVKYFTKMLSAASEAVIFLFLGQALVTDQHKWHTGFTLWSVVLCLVLRFLIVFALCFIANRGRKVRKIDWHEQFIMAYGGLRGAVSFSLCVMLSSDKSFHRDMFITTTLVVVLFTVFIQGTTIKPLVKLMKIGLKKEQYESLVGEIHGHVQDHMMAGVEEVVGRWGNNYVRQRFELIDERYLRRWFLKGSCRNKYSDIMTIFDKMALEQHYAGLPGSKAASKYQEKKLQRQATLLGGGSEDSDGEQEKDELSWKSISSIPESFTMKGRFDETLPGILTHPEMLDNSRTRRLLKNETSQARPASSALSVDILGLPGAEKARKQKTRKLIPKKNVDEKTAERRELNKMLSFRPATALHQTYDKNLVNDDDQDLMQQLHHKTLLTQRMMRSRTLSPASSEQSLAVSPSPKHPPVTPFLSAIVESGGEDEIDQTQATTLEATPNVNGSSQPQPSPRRDRPTLQRGRTIDLGISGESNVDADTPLMKDDETIM
ncbi:Na(+)/H(+) exchanger beta-like isoform X2 [Lineus longissimus]|uniref:Na(+)/H(+) exchanger beta-like isoform X2 n=1 Tax=Lineus longissimus TaxID=88925 RepID=UPI00315DBE72